MLGGKKLSSTEIAEVLEVSRRSVQRYMEALANAGFPVIATSGVNGGYSLPKDFPYKGDLFTVEEYSEIRDCILAGAISEEEKKRCIRKLKRVVRDEDEQPSLLSEKDGGFVDVTFFADESICDDLAAEFGTDRLTPCENGYLVHIYEPNDKKLIRRLLSFGANITIVEPKSVQLEVKRVAEEIFEKYKE